MFDEYYDMKDSLNFDPKYKKEDIVHFLKEYLSAYSSEDNKQDWFDRLKAMALSCGYVDMKTYKSNPDAYIGSVADASNIIRFALTGRTNTPDLYEIMKLMGVGEVNQRLNYVINKLK